jgi:hypothetical protein
VLDPPSTINLPLKHLTLHYLSPIRGWLGKTPPWVHISDDGRILISVVRK